MVKITNSAQFAMLVSELVENPRLAKGFNRGTIPSNFKEQWQNISTKLNALGPPLRDADGWQKVWRDLKCKVKKKIVHNKAECRATGGGSYKQMPLSPLEDEVANLLQFEKQLNPTGMPQGVVIANGEDEAIHLEGQEIVAVESQNEDIETDIAVLFDEHTIPSATETTMENPESATPLRRNRKRNEERSQRQTLLEKHDAMQERVLTQMSATLTELSSSFNSVKNAIKDSARYQRKLLEVEERKIQIMARQQEREEQLFQSEMKLKKIKLEIKEKELQVLFTRSMQ